MSEAFLKVVNMSISAGWLVLAVLALRLILKRAPKWVNVLLWGIVAVRLICPFSIESALSLIPSTEVISTNAILEVPIIDTGFPLVNHAINPVLQESVVMIAPEKGISLLKLLILIASSVWLAGGIIMVGYAMISYRSLHRRVREAVILQDNIYRSVYADSPFVLGIIRPRIYLPCTLSDEDVAHVIAHEQAHIRRKDHWWKPLGFLLLTIHWFNPLMWIAYILLCRDIELACDEKVIAKLGNGQRADYTQALVSCSVNRRRIAACPIAFGEVGVKERVKNVMNYKKPCFWIVVVAVVVCIAVAVCFLTNPVTSVRNPWVQEYTPGAEGIRGNVDKEKYESISEDFAIGADQYGRAVFKDPHKAFDTFLVLYADEIKIIQKEFDLLPISHGTFALYKTYGWQTSSDSSRVSFVSAFLDLYENSFTKDVPPSTDVPPTPAAPVAIMWFDYFTNPEAMIWDGRLEINLPEFPDVTFRWYPEKIEAVTEEGITPLYTGMPIWNTYFCDLTGDGLPELCSTLSFGSGMIDNRVMIYDYANGVSYELSDRGYYDYSLRLDEVDGRLYVDKTLYPNGEAIASGPLVYRDSCIQVEEVSTDRTTVPDVTFGGNLNLGLNAEIIDIDPFRKILYVTDLDQSANVFGDRCAIDCTYAISRYNLLYVNYGDPNDVRTIDFSAFGVGDSVIIGMYDSELEKAFNGSAIPEQVQLATQKFSDTAVTIPTGMIPTDTYAVGLCNGALMLPMENGTYRYLLTETNPQGVTADELLFSFDETDIGEPIHHEVYSLKQYPDRSKVLLISTKNGPWLCEYSPPQRCSDTALSDAIAAGYPVTEDGIATHGQAAWQKFYEQTQKGRSASITVAHYYTLDPAQCDSGYYEIFQQDYPCLYLDQLSYDGKQFTITSSDGSTRTYEYLMKYEASGTPLAGNTEHKSIVHYTLTHDAEHTYEELWASVTTSFYGGYIDHYTIYSESKQ